MSFDIRQKEKQEIEKQVYNLEKSIAIRRNNIENNEREIFRITESVQSREKEFSRWNQQETEYNSAFALKEKELESLINNEQNRQSNIASLEKQRDKLQEELNVVNRNIDSKQNEYDLLRSMIDNFEGFPESIRFLHDHWKKDLILLSDILDVDEQYKAPIELYLENYLNHFVVSNLAEALHGITLLKNAQQGKANFFLLDRIEKTQETKKLSDHKFVRAIDVIKIENKFKTLLENLLSKVYIFSGEPDELKETDQDIVIISSTGTYLKHGFTIAGGSVGLFEGKKIGRKQNLEKLAQFLQENASLKTDLNNRLTTIKKDLQNLKSSNFNGFIDKIKKNYNI
ncbi:MAG: hypothetical protein IPJ39_20925 [Saprospiraceae bacterium]|nr:hypothetical protein [Saprospiraceae bacterium]